MITDADGSLARGGFLDPPGIGFGRSGDKNSVYLNAAATSFPKPPCVLDAVARALACQPVEPGRSAGGGVAPDPLAVCREELAALFCVADSCKVSLLPSATYGINLVVLGMLSAGDHVVTTVLEHNSVLRPLAHAERDRGVAVTYMSPGADGELSCDQLKSALRENTKLVSVTHASNVTGSIQPVENIAVLAAERGIPLLIDAAQSAGTIPLQYDRLPGRVFVAFAGHKGLLGPAGVGGLILPDEELAQTIVGGTGVHSEKLVHPFQLPLRHEAGTPNLSGIAGLAAGVRYVRGRGVKAEGRHRQTLVHSLRERLLRQARVRALPTAKRDCRAGILSFTVSGWAPEDLGFVLRESFSIHTRTGLHCAPLTNKLYGTMPHGTVRVSFGSFNTMADVDRLVDAVQSLEER